MRLKPGLYFGVAAVAIMALCGMPSAPASAQQANTAAVAVGDSEIGGVVRSANGPEAGVWVIAETRDLPTKYVKIVVTDDQGRYLLPHLAKANYEISVRGRPVDPTKDKRILAGLYGIGYDPNDGTIWGSVLAMPGGVVHVIPGDNPPATTLSEYYEVPFNEPKAAVNGFGPRGMDIDRKGVVWIPLASGHLASFDRKKCKGPLNGPNATGRHCPEGWTLYQFPGPQFEGINELGAVQSSYYTWVDQFDTLGLGKDVPMATGNMSDSIEALVDGTFVTLRIPYPMGFQAKGMDGRIDDPNGGWKGRGVWSTYAGRAPYHIEGGKGTTSKVVHFQVRPDPLTQ
jgi:hypothetical protein